MSAFAITTDPEEVSSSSSEWTDDDYSNRDVLKVRKEPSYSVKLRDYMMEDPQTLGNPGFEGATAQIPVSLEERGAKPKKPKAFKAHSDDPMEFRQQPVRMSKTDALQKLKKSFKGLKPKSRQRFFSPDGTPEPERYQDKDVSSGEIMNSTRKTRGRLPSLPQRMENLSPISHSLRRTRSFSPPSPRGRLFRPRSGLASEDSGLSQTGQSLSHGDRDSMHLTPAGEQPADRQVVAPGLELVPALVKRGGATTDVSGGPESSSGEIKQTRAVDASLPDRPALDAQAVLSLQYWRKR